MDPNESLRELRRNTNRIFEIDDDREARAEEFIALAVRNAELFIALDGWLTNNGFPPDAWNSRSPSPAWIERTGS